MKPNEGSEYIKELWPALRCAVCSWRSNVIYQMGLAGLWPSSERCWGGSKRAVSLLKNGLQLKHRAKCWGLCLYDVPKQSQTRTQMGLPVYPSLWRAAVAWEKRGTWEVYSSTWRPFFFQWSLPDSSPSVKTPTKWENTPQFDYLGREGVPLTNINGGRKVLNRHIKIRAGFHCTPWAAPCTWCWQSLCQQRIQLKDGAGRVFWGFGFYCYHSSYGQSYLQ